MEKPNNHYNKYLRQYAQNLRNRSTKSEIILWSGILKAKKMGGYSFRRQRPIDVYIADFICLELKLIIEVDGASHNEPDVQVRDRIRDKRLRALGFSILRIPDGEIFRDIKSVSNKIRQKIAELEAGV